MKKHITIGVLVSTVLLFFVLRNINIKNTAEIIFHGQFLWLIPAVFTFILSFVFRATRWKYLFLPIKKFASKQLFSSLVMGFAANCIFPARFGEIVRAYVVGKKHNVSKSASLATIVLERITDGVAILILVGASTFFLHKFPPWTKRVMFISIVLFFGILVALFVIVTNKHFIDWLKKVPFIKYELKEKIVDKTKKFVTGFDIISDVKNFSIVILLAICVWLCETFNMFLLLKITNIHLSFPIIIFILFAVVVAVTIPAAPGSIGTYEFFFVASMIFFGVPKEKAVASALTMHVIGMVYVMTLGIYYFFKEGISYREISQVN